MSRQETFKGLRGIVGGFRGGLVEEVERFWGNLGTEWGQMRGLARGLEINKERQLCRIMLGSNGRIGGMTMESLACVDPI